MKECSVEDKVLDFSPTFCSLPFNHRFIGPAGEEKPCSRFLRPLINYDDYESTLKELQHYKLTGKRHPGCRKCYEEEDAGRSRSLRQIYNNVSGFNYDIVHDVDPHNPKVTWLELSFSNRCNLKCRMCGPFYSTTWFEDWAEVPEYAFGIPGVPKNKADIESFLAENKKKPVTFDVTTLDKYIPDLRMVKLTGGEPFIIPEYDYILEKVHEVGNAENMWLDYSTNLTVRPKKRLKELWSKYKQIKFATSLDGIGKVIEYQRHPCKWEMVDTVMNDLMQIPNAWVGVRTTQTIYNILDMPNIAMYFAELEDKYHNTHSHVSAFGEDSWLNFVQASTPEFVSITVLPKWAKDLVAERLAWSAPTKKIQDNFDHIVNYMYNEDNSHKLPQFIDYTRKLDKLRNESFAEVVPELAGVLDEI
jgi:hypothetical protein